MYFWLNFATSKVKEIDNLIFDVKKWISTRDIIHNYAAMGTSKIWIWHSTEPLLADSVPYLKFTNSFVYLYSLHFNIDSYGAAVLFEFSIGKFMKQGRFASVCISKHYNLKQSRYFVDFLGVELNSWPNIFSLTLCMDNLTLYMENIFVLIRGLFKFFTIRWTLFHFNFLLYYN